MKCFVHRLGVLLPISLLIFGLTSRVFAQEFRQTGTVRPVTKGTILGNLAPVARSLRLIEARKQFGLRGEGVSVVVMGGGVFTSHEDFRDRISLPPLMNGPALPGAGPDRLGVTTHSAGLIAADGTNQGVAPKVTIIPLKITNDYHLVQPDLVVLACRWILGSLDKQKIGCIYLDVGDQGNHRNLNGLENSAMTRALRRVAEKVPVVVPSGDNYFRVKRPGACSPAIYPEIISVGGVFHDNVGTVKHASEAEARITRPGQLAPFSQRMPGELGTDIFAPCGPLTSTGIDGRKSQSINLSTATSAALTAGVVALMQELHRRRTGKFATVDRIRSWLRRGGVRIWDTDQKHDNVPHFNDRFVRLDADGTLMLMSDELLSKETPNEPDTVATIETTDEQKFTDIEFLLGMEKVRRDFRFGIPRRSVTGRGLAVAMIGTGLLVTHDDFRSRVFKAINFTSDNKDNVTDNLRHGADCRGCSPSRNCPASTNRGPESPRSSAAHQTMEGRHGGAQMGVGASQ